jgi:hypothetical protein
VRQLSFIRAVLVSIALASISSPAGAQVARAPEGAPGSLTGKWQTASGVLVLVLTANDTLVSGTLTHRDDSVPIQRGTFSNGKLTFTAWVTDRLDNFWGELRGDTLSLRKDRIDTRFILRRVKESESRGRVRPPS